MQADHRLGFENIRKLVWQIAIPSMLAQFVSVLYSIVDRMYIGHITDVGSLALGGVGVCGPIVTLIGSFAFLVAFGGSPLMSISLGQGDRKRADGIVASSFLMLCLLSAALFFLIFSIKAPMLRLFGASDALFPYADSYLSIYLFGTAFSLLSIGMNQFIISQGFAAYGMFSVISGAIINIVLDPIFIYACHMGVRGAALATVLSQFVSCLIVLGFLFSRHALVRITFHGYSPHIACHILLLGATPFLIIAVDNLMIISLNMILRKYGGAMLGDQLITCATIAQSFMLMVTMPLGGITGGTQTILAFNYGAGEANRVRSAQREIFKLCIGFAALMFLLARIGSPLFVRLFVSDTEIAAKAVQAIHIFTLAIIPLSIQYEIVDGFTGLGQVRYTFPLSFFRKGVYFTALFLLPLFLPIELVFYAEPISDLIPPIVSMLVYRKAINRTLAAAAPRD